MPDHLATIQAIYDAFAAGDVPRILDLVAEDVQWEEWADNTAQRSGVPWMAARRGKAGVAEFFQYLGTQMKVHDAQVLSIMSGGNQVAVEFVIEVEVPSTGGRYRDEEIHLWTLDDRGQVSRLRHYTDTAKHLRAWGHDVTDRGPTSDHLPSAARAGS